MSDEDYVIVLRARTTVTARLEARQLWDRLDDADAEGYFVYQSDGNIVHGLELSGVWTGHARG